MIWLGERRARTRGEGRGRPAARLIIYTLTSPEVHRILAAEPERSAAGRAGSGARGRLQFTVAPSHPTSRHRNSKCQGMPMLPAARLSEYLRLG
jgi:hypothetical protein